MRAWIARDKCGSVHCFRLYPSSGYAIWTDATGSSIHILDSDLPEGINPQWEDDEPIEVKLKIEKI